MGVPQCKFSCPNCGTDAIVQVPGRERCADDGCPYLFQVFGKRDRQGAKDFYMTQPSKMLKYLRRAEDGPWLVAFCEKAEPFIVDNIFDLIAPKALQTIQVGLSERIKRPVTIIVKLRQRPGREMGSEYPVNIIEKEGPLLFSVDLGFQNDLDNLNLSEDLRHAFEDNEIMLSQEVQISAKNEGSEWLIDDKHERSLYYIRKEEGNLAIYELQIFGRVDVIEPKAYYCERCKEIREYPEGEEACLLYDAVITQQMIEAEDPVSLWQPCWSGLVDYAFPLVINGIVSGVFFTGQIKWVDPEGEEALLLGSIRVSEKLPLTAEQLLDLAADSADRSKLDRLLEEFEGFVKTIGEVAENRYWAERSARDSEFLSEVFSFFTAVEDAEWLWKILEIVLGRLNEFSFFLYSAFLLSSGDTGGSFTLKEAAGFDADGEQILQLTEAEAEGIFEKEDLLIVREAGETKNHGLYRKLCQLIAVDDVNCALLFPCDLGDIGKGLIIMAERTEEISGYRVIGRISKQRKAFLTRVARDIKFEIQSVLTIAELRKALKEKSDLMAAAGHVLVAPLASAYGKTEHLTTLVSETDPDAANRNASEIVELCSNIDEDVIRSIRQVRSFMFFTTIGTDAEEYRFDRRISLAGLLQKCTDEFRYTAKSRGIRIDLKGSLDDMPMADFDRDKLEIAFSNLLDNAVKYSHANKVVNVNVSFDEDSDIYTVSVSDFGIGIPEVEHKRIFEQYYRSALKDPRRFIPGTGIGLSVAKQIVERHGGKIWVTSKPGSSVTVRSSSVEGFNTTFWVQIHRERRRLE